MVRSVASGAKRQMRYAGASVITDLTALLDRSDVLAAGAAARIWIALGGAGPDGAAIGTDMPVPAIDAVLGVSVASVNRLGH